MATSGALVAGAGAPSLIGNSLARNSSSRRSHCSSQPGASTVYKKRDEADFTQDELEHLDNLNRKTLDQKLKRFRIFGHPMDQLKNWLYFFDGRDDHQTYGAELQQGLVLLWGTFILMEALLAGVATQPFITVPGLDDRELACYGLLWMLSLLTDMFALATTGLFLGYLLANPSKLSWLWLCSIGILRGVPAILMLLATFMSLVAIGYTTFALYGWEVGVACITFEVVVIAISTWFAFLLGDTATKVIESELMKNKVA